MLRYLSADTTCSKRQSVMCLDQSLTSENIWWIMIRIICELLSLTKKCQFFITFIRFHKFVSIFYQVWLMSEDSQKLFYIWDVYIEFCGK